MSRRMYGQTLILVGIKYPNKRDDLTAEWRKLHNEELSDHPLVIPNIVRVVKSRRMRWVGHGGGERCAQGSGGET